MALYWPTLQLSLCVFVWFVYRYVAPPGECYYNDVAIYFHLRVWYRALSLRYACIRSFGIILIP